MVSLTGIATSAPDFETALLDDLPRGHADKPLNTSGESGLFSRWLRPPEMIGDKWSPKGGLWLGRRDGRDIGWNDDRGVCLISGARSGKGRTFLNNNLLLYEGSALVIDPKGELAAITAGRRGDGTARLKETDRHVRPKDCMGQYVYVLDPFGQSGCKTACFNPLDELDLKNDDVIDDAAMFADAMIIQNERDSHWTESAQALLTAIILMVLNVPDVSKRNLLTVRRLLTLTDDLLDGHSVREMTKEDYLIDLLKKEVDKGSPAGFICGGVAEQFSSMGENSKERSGIFSTARTQTAWLDSPKLKNLLSKSDFDLAELKQGKLDKATGTRDGKRSTIYLCLPVSRMGTHKRWFRLMVSLALTVMERIQQNPTPRVLFCLEEFYQLGHMQSVINAVAQMPGLGVKFVTVLQNLGQLQEHYQKSWETFLANSGVVIAFGNSDTTTLKTLREGLGETVITDQVSSGLVGEQRTKSNAPTREDRKSVPLLAEHEIKLAFQREKMRALVLTMDHEPAVVERINYDAPNDPRFAGLYDPDPRYTVKA